MASSEAYMDEFKSAVLAHLKTEIDDDAWAYFRKLSQTGLAEEEIPEAKDWTREDLVAEAVTVDSESLNDLLGAFGERLIVKIGAIADRPIHFIVEEGIYAWAPTDDNGGDTLSLWITFPAYPPGW
jgi:hypothetical protein